VGPAGRRGICNLSRTARVREGVLAEVRGRVAGAQRASLPPQLDRLEATKGVGMVIANGAHQGIFLAFMPFLSSASARYHTQGPRADLVSRGLGHCGFVEQYSQRLPRESWHP